MIDSVWMEVFQTGDYGEKGVYDEGDLDELVSNFHEVGFVPPVTVDHRESGPAYGWLEEFERRGKKLWAKVRFTVAEFAEAVRQGLFRNRSLEIYRDYQGKGKLVRALTFLGARVPEVKGLGDFVFDDQGEVLKIDYGETKQRRTKEMPTNEEIRAAVAAMSEADLRQVEGVQRIVTPLEEKVKSQGDEIVSFQEELGKLKGGATEPEPKLEIPAEVQKRIDEMEKQIDRQRREIFSERLENEIAELKRDGKFLPAWETRGIVAFMETLEFGGEVVKFGEGAAAKEEKSSAWFREFLKSMPEIVKMGETADEEVPAGVDVPKSDGKCPVDNVDLTVKAKAYEAEMKKQGTPVSFSEALRVVSVRR